MNKTLFGLALLSYNWDNGKNDIIDSYIPLICNIIHSKIYSKITREEIQRDLKDFYGINVPLGAIESIFKRMSKDGFLDKNVGEWQVNHKKVEVVIKNGKKDELNDAFNELVFDLKEYSINVFEAGLNNEQIETGIIAFFKEYDLDLLFAGSNGNSVLPKVKESKKDKYIIAKFITDLQSSNPQKFQTVLKLAKGYAIASLITYEDIQHYKGNLNDVEIFLDAPIIFNLLELNGDSNYKLTQELIEVLSENGAKFKVFELNYGEVVKTIEDAIKRLNSKNYDLARSSRILRTAVRENISPSQLQIKLQQFDVMLKNYSINKVQSPSLSDFEYKYQIDEVKLTKLIEGLYKKTDNQLIPLYIVEKIERDVEGISNIFKIRKQSRAINLKSSKAILLTSNEKISYAARIYEHQDWKYVSAIPVCVTDVFLSTIMWANYPTKNEDLNIRQLMYECYNIMELDNRLLNRFYDDINRMRKENVITEEQFYLLSASNLAYALLERKTFNDIEEYSDKTPAEILEDLQLSIKNELLLEKNKLSLIDNNIRKFSKFIAKATFVILGVFLIGITFLIRSLSPGSIFDTWVEIILYPISGILAIFGILRWMEIIPTKSKIEAIIEEHVFKVIGNVLNKK